MDSARVKKYFDSLAPEWDGHCVHKPEVIRTILDCAGIGPGRRVLDVACGTGILFPYYMQRNIGALTAVDISDEMLKGARRKYPQEWIRLICADAQILQLAEHYDCIVIYNALPHFCDPAALIEHLSSFRTPGGRLTVAHGSSRKDINDCHTGSAAGVSLDLMPAQDLADCMSRWMTVDTVISDDEKYIVSGY